MRLLLLLPILYASLVWITVARPLTYSTLHFQDPAAGLTPGENCEMCQIVLRTVFGHFSANVPSRKKLTNQLKHECKRHFHYRRRCLMAVKDQGDFLYREMTGGDFKPIKPCFIMKECKRLQSPLPEDFQPDNSTYPPLDMTSSIISLDAPTTIAPPDVQE
uniref:Saposin B-type domain-containing protein n=2 Tax=Caenorhabditis elegans TaxID=6239 RepID=U4PEX8_CAEEL|eukprot:NP_001294502.1 Uncharacterized protein CELE_Y77E11A.14 [Caenorhabditis elegans]